MYNNNAANNYSDYSNIYKEDNNRDNSYLKMLIFLIIALNILLAAMMLLRANKDVDTKYENLRLRICEAANKYVLEQSLLKNKEVGQSIIIKYERLADENLIETQIKNPYYDGNIFKKGTVDKYYSLDNSVRVIVREDGTYNCELVENANDITSPELRLQGDPNIILAVGTEFEDPGYEVTDDYDGDITNKVSRSGNVDISKAGTYTITYSVEDSAGNTTSKERKIVYEEYSDMDITLGSINDTIAPAIKLKGANPYCMVKGTQYVEPGATATDNVDGDITDRISIINKVTGNRIGSFRIAYKVEDSSGNSTLAYRAVLVTTSCSDKSIDSEYEKVINNAPVITLTGKNSVTINRGDDYIDLGATAYDKEDGNITYKIVTDTTGVNVNSAGVYKVIYRVTDSNGVTSNATKIVTVKELTTGNPSVRFIENKSNITVDIGEGKDSLLKVPKAVDEKGTQLRVTTKIEDYITKEAISSINWKKTGKYRVIYTAIHGNGALKQTKSMVVTINDVGAIIGGKTVIDIPLRTQRCILTKSDLTKGGVTFETNGNSTPIVTINYDDEKYPNMICNVGTYKVIVSAEVSDNKSSSTEITVNVVDNGGQEVTPKAPGKVVITKNSANKNDPYNSAEKWVGEAARGASLEFKTTLSGNTEISYFEYSKDCVDSDGSIPKLSSTSGELRWTEEGKSNVCIRAVSTDGVAGEWSNPVKLNLDFTGPDAEFTHTWNDKKDDWHNSNSLTLTYKASDIGSGLDHFEYTYDDVKAKKANDIVTYNEATGKLTVYENTEPTRPVLFIYVRAVDKAGNKGEWTKNPAYANIDTVKPEVPVITVEGNNTPLVKLNATFNDGASRRPSGFGKLAYTLNDGPELEETSKTITMPTSSKQTSYDVRVWAVDKAGNRSNAYANKKVTVAATVGLIGVTINDGDNDITGKSCGTIAVGETVTLTAMPNPTNAGVGLTNWSISVANMVEMEMNKSDTKTIKIIGKQKGTATITATVGGKKSTCTLTVKEQIITCKPSTYLPKGSSTCAECPAGSYCEGGSYPDKPDVDTGKKTCATGYTSNKGASKCMPKTVTVIFHKNDGTNETLQQTFTYGEKGNKFGYNTNGTPRWQQIGQFGNWTRSSYKLLGWNTNSKATSSTLSIYSGISDAWINSNEPKIDVYAVWQKNGLISIKLSDSEIYLTKNQTYQIKINYNPANIDNKKVRYNVRYESGGPIIKVDENGLITALRPGNALLAVYPDANSNLREAIEIHVTNGIFNKCTKNKVIETIGNIKTYECMSDISPMAQNFAISEKYVYYASPLNAWCTLDSKISRGDISGKCKKDDANTTRYLGSNYIYKFDRETGALVSTKLLQYAGHGQSIDVTSKDELYINYFSNTYLDNTSDSKKIGASNAGVAIINNMPNAVDKSIIYPNSAIKVSKDGKIQKFSSSNTLGSAKYNDEVVKLGKSNPMYFPQIAIDEANDKIAIMDSTITSNKNRTVYIYKLSSFKNGTYKLLKKIYIGKVCGGIGNTFKNCAGQGIEISGNYIYTVQDYEYNGKKYGNITKIDYNSCPTRDVSNSKCSKVKNINLTKSKYSGKGLADSEIEGISYFNGRVYVSLYERYTDNTRKSKIVLVNGI